MRHAKIVAALLSGPAFSLPVFVPAAFAQAPVGPPPGFEALPRPGGSRELLPELQPAPAPRPDLVLPPIQPPQPGAPLSAGPRVFIREVRIVGATVVSAEDLAKVAAPYVNRELEAQDLQELRQALTLAYIQRGYINSGAVLPDQRITDGVVTYQVVEGRVTEIAVEGNVHLDADYIRNRLALGSGPPLNVGELDRRLQIMLQDPLVERLNVEIQPGLRPGEARLASRVDEAERFSLTAGIANNSPPSVGGVRGELFGVARNITGYGETTTLRYGRTEGLDEGSASLSVPVTAEDTTVSFRFDRNASGVIEERFRGLDIESRSETYEVGISHPVYRTPRQTLTLGATFARRENETFLLGEPFSFTPGVDNGRSRVSVFRLYQDWIDRQPDEVLALRSTFSIGIDALGATDTGVEPDSTFFTWLGQAQYVRRIFEDVQVVARGDVQLAKDPLFSLEQFAVGGLSTVRGYRENQLVRDNAVVGSIEVRVPVLRHPLPWTDGATDEGVLSFAPFVDYGYGWNRSRPTPSPRTIASIGPGLRWDLGSRFQLQLYYGYAFNDVPSDDEDLQDKGVHFRLTSRLY